MEAAGFPKRAALNGKRFIPQIEKFSAQEAEKPKPVDNTNHPDFHTRIEHLPQEAQSRLCECFGTADEAVVKRQYARLVCRFGD
jgi:hypothetical protein